MTLDIKQFESHCSERRGRSAGWRVLKPENHSFDPASSVFSTLSVTLRRKHTSLLSIMGEGQWWPREQFLSSGSEGWLPRRLCAPRDTFMTETEAERMLLSGTSFSSNFRKGQICRVAGYFWIDFPMVDGLSGFFFNFLNQVTLWGICT